MSMWTAIVIIVAVVVMSRLAREGHLPLRHSRLSGWMGADREPHQRPDPEMKRELQELRERIKVLERIATEGNSLDARETRRISEEIEALRDRQDSSAG